MISSPPFFPLMNPFYWYLFTSLAAEFFLCMNGGASVVLAWKNSRHFTTQPLVSPRNEASGTDWWRVTTQIWAVLLIGRRYRVENSLQPIRSTLDSNLSSVWNFFSRFSDVFCRGINVSVRKCRLFSMVPLTHFLPHFLVEPQLSLSRENTEDERFCSAFTVV